MSIVPSTATDANDLYRRANALALITIFYNILEGVVSVGFGAADETFALFGFGLDSYPHHDSRYYRTAAVAQGRIEFF